MLEEPRNHHRALDTQSRDVANVKCKSREGNVVSGRHIENELLLATLTKNYNKTTFLHLIKKHLRHDWDMEQH